MNRGIYLFHALFFAPFVLRWLGVFSPKGSGPPADRSQTLAAPHRRLLVLSHMIGLAVLYFGIGQSALPGRIPEVFPLQRQVGAFLILLGAGLVLSALLVFRSWRLEAELKPEHELTMAGPFRFVRHPIYAALNLLGLGSFVWVPTPIVFVGFVLIFIAGDLRARAEEKLLVGVFGDVYRDYMKRVKRFFPGIY